MTSFIHNSTQGSTDRDSNRFGSVDPWFNVNFSTFGWSGTTYRYLEEDFVGYFPYCSSLWAAYLSEFLKTLYQPVAFFYNRTFGFVEYASSCVNQAFERIFKILRHHKLYYNQFEYSSEYPSWGRDETWGNFCAGKDSSQSILMSFSVKLHFELKIASKLIVEWVPDFEWLLNGVIYRYILMYHVILKL